MRIRSSRSTVPGRLLAAVLVAVLTGSVAACAGAGYVPSRELVLEPHDHTKPLGYDGGSCRGWLDPALAFPDARDPRIVVVPASPLESRCGNSLPGYGAEMLSVEPVGSPAWVTGRIRVDDVPGARYAFFLYDDEHEITVELDRSPDGWEAIFATFRPHPAPESDRIVATHSERRRLDSLDASAWHTVSIHRGAEALEAYLDGERLGRAKRDGCRVRPRCLPEGSLRLRVNAWAPVGSGVEEMEERATYRIAWARIGEGPRAMPRVDPERPAAGSEVRFDGRRSGTSGEAEIRAWSWSFGDGATGEGPEVTHRYAEEGRYPATLVITDSRGVRDTARAPITVGPRPGDHGPGR